MFEGIASGLKKRRNILQMYFSRHRENGKSIYRPGENHRPAARKPTRRGAPFFKAAEHIKLWYLRFRLKHRLVGEIHYINGPEVLPLPLESKEEADLLAQLSAGDTKVREQLIVRNLRLVVYIARKFEAKAAGIEDLISIGTIGLIKAVNTFCPDRNIKLATYASRCIENEILMYLRKTVHLKGEISIDEPLNIDWDGNELLLSDILGSEPDLVGKGVETEDEHNLLHRLVQKLLPREQEIMEMRFGMAGHQEHTQKQVADKLGISQSYISRLEKRIIERLKRELERAS